MRKEILAMMALISASFILTTASYGATWYISPSGSDNANGSLSSPFKTLRHAIEEASDGDIIELRNGTYPSDEIRINKDNLTIRSYAGEWAIIKAPVDKGEDIASCLWYNDETTKGGTLERLEIIGGSFYGIKFESNWNWGLPDNERSGASGIKIIGCKIHDTGRDCIKITPGCNDISIIACEIYNSGVGPENSEQNGGPNAEGIDNVNGSRMKVQHCYFHDISTNGLYAKGGAVDCIIEANLFINMGEAGIGVGFYTDGEWFDAKSNPKYYESINTIVRNNIVINTQHAGIVVVGAKNCKIYNNTVVTASPIYHAPLTFLEGEVGIDENTTFHPVSTGLEILNNIFVDQSPNGDEDFTILMRQGSLEGSNKIDYNLFYKSNGSAITFDDGDWPAKGFSEWRSLGNDAHGYEKDPKLNGGYHLSAGSPCIDKGIAVSVSHDYDGGPRSGSIDIGADEYQNGSNLAVPPPAGIVGTGVSVLPTSTQNVWLADKIKVFPNPSTDYIKVDIANTAIKRIALYDINGSSIVQATSNEVRTNHLPTGQYALVVSLNDGTMHTLHVVVQH